MNKDLLLIDQAFSFTLKRKEIFEIRTNFKKERERRILLIERKDRVKNT